MSTFTFPIDDFLSHRKVQDFLFPLHAGSIGRKTVFKARVKRLRLIDRASLGWLPDHLQNQVWKQLRAARKEAQRMQDEGADPEDINEAMAANEANIAVANVYVTHGFIEPRVVVEPEKVDRANGVFHISDIDPEDRIAYLVGCVQADSAQARHFESFRPERPADVSPVAPGEARAPITFGDPRPE